LKHKNKSHKKIEEEQADVEIDTEKAKKVISFIKDKTIPFFNNPKTAIIVLILIAMYLAFFYRMYPVTLPVTDIWAQSSVEGQFKAQISQQVRQEFPNLPQQNIDAKVNDIFLENYKNNKQQIDSQVQQTSDYFRSRLQDKDNKTYLLAIDPYYYWRLTKNHVQNGHPGEFEEDGVAMSKLQLAPSKNPVQMSFHVWFQSLIFKISKLFNPSLTIEDLPHTIFFTPVIIVMLAIIPLFLIGRRFAGNLGGFIAAGMLALHSSLLSRTPAGFADTDAYNVLFPLLIMLFIMLALREQKHWKTAIYGALAGVGIGVFSWAWGGWWYIFDFIIIAAVGYGVYLVINHFVHSTKKKRISLIKEKHFQAFIIAFIAFLIASGIVVSLFTSFQTFVSTPIQPLSFTHLKIAAHANFWPNVYTTVAELNPGNIPSIIDNMGGSKGAVFMFAMTMLGVSALLWKKKNLKIADYAYALGSAVWYILIIWLGRTSKIPSIIFSSQIVFLALLAVPIGVGILLKIMQKEQDDYSIVYSLLLSIWIIGTIFAATKGIRFTLLMVPPFALGIGILLGKVHKLVSSTIAKALDIDYRIIGIILFILATTILLPSLSNADRIANGEVPSMNDAWYDTLIDIKEGSQPDAIISSWWDFGHQFITIAERGATADGASQNTPQAHWLGKLLNTPSENKSIGILRMLNCDANGAFEKIDDQKKDTVKTINIIEQLLGVNSATAKTILEDNNFSEDQIIDIMESTHCTPPESFLITSEDMVSKAGVWAHFGSWDFSKAKVWNSVKNLPELDALNVIKEELSLEPAEATKLFYTLSGYSEQQGNAWISPWPGYFNSRNGCTKSRTSNDIVECQNGMILNTTSGQAFAATQQGFVPMESTSIYNDVLVSRKTFTNAQKGLGAVFTENNGTITSALGTDILLTDSIFTRLFFLDGAGTKYFTKFSDKQSVVGQRILTWQVDWDKYLEDFA
jgi:dolichyl-phosphooligosaccharide-protein glycotransferase